MYFHVDKDSFEHFFVLLFQNEEYNRIYLFDECCVYTFTEFI